MKLTQEIAERKIEKLGLGFSLVSNFQGTRKSSRVDIRCRCGKVFNVSWKHISQGHTKSCGCLQREEMIGKRFGNLVVVEQIPKKEKSYGGRWWRCKCDCGGYKETITTSLTRGATSSCGCSRFGENSVSWKGYKSISGTFWIQLQHSAKKRRITFDISKEYAYSILESQKFQCALSGVPIELHSHGKETTASLDRIDSSNGYVNGNIQWVYKPLNIMKNDMSMEEFRGWCQKIINHLTNLKPVVV